MSSSSVLRLVRWGAPALACAVVAGLIPAAVPRATATTTTLPTLRHVTTVSATKSSYVLVRLPKPMKVVKVDDSHRVKVRLGKGASYAGFALIPDVVQYRTVGLEVQPPALFVPNLAGRPQGTAPFTFDGTEPDGTYAAATRVLPAGRYRLYVFTKGLARVTVTWPAGAASGKVALSTRKSVPAAFQSFSADVAHGPAGSFGATNRIPTVGLIYMAFWQSGVVSEFNEAQSCYYAGGPSPDATVYSVPACLNNGPVAGNGALPTYLLSGATTGLGANTYGGQIYWHNAGAVQATGGLMLWLGTK